MKGLLLFDNENDVVFMKVDEELLIHLYHLAVRDGIGEQLEKNHDVSLKKDTVVQIFAPLIASYRVMELQLGNRYKSIETTEATRIVFDKVQNYIVMGICSKVQSLYTLEKYVSVFCVLAELLYGPSLHLINEEIEMCNGCTRSEFLSTLLDAWQDLRENQQMFLVEAVERLLIDHDAAGTCINVLESALQKIRTSNSKDYVFAHAFLLVDQKLLSFYSSRNSTLFEKKDLLLFIIAVHALCISERTCKEKEPSNESKTDGKMSKLFVFLKSELGEVIPHYIYIVNVVHRINLVLISEMTERKAISTNLSLLINSLDNIQCHPNYRNSLLTFESLEYVYGNLIESLLKPKNEQFNMHLRQLVAKWKLMKESNIEEFMKNSKSDTLDSRLESTVSALCEICRTAFVEIVAYPELNLEHKLICPDRKEILLQIQKLASKQLLESSQYLTAKAEKNICMSSYMEDYPGLIHFIYVDRNNHFVIAPSVILEDAHLDGSTSLKKKIWDMVPFGQQYIDGRKNFVCEWHREDLNYSYRICFEDSTGKSMKPSRKVAENFAPKGIICGNFYQKLKEKCFPHSSLDHIYCYEFFSIHLDSTSSSKMHEHQNHLCASMWEYSEAYKASLDLL